MEKLNSSPKEVIDESVSETSETSKVSEINEANETSKVDENDEANETGKAGESKKTNELAEKPDFVKQIESFDINNLTSENIEFINHTIQNVFRENFPVDDELINIIPDHMMIVSDEDFIRLRHEDSKDIEKELGYYSLELDKILIDISKHNTPGELFSTMFHESLHFVSIRPGAGLSGGFCYPDLGENEPEGLVEQLDEGIRVMVEGTTQNITETYTISRLGFDPKPHMFGYSPECIVMDAIWKPFTREERLQAYFNTPLEALRVRIESAFAENYNADQPTGVFADSIVAIAKATKQMEIALESWKKDGNPEPVQNIINVISKSVSEFITRDAENKKEQNQSL